MSASDYLPREKALNYGMDSLTNSELLALVLKSAYKDKNVYKLSEEIIEMADGFENLPGLSYGELISIKGIKKAKALEIMAILEIARRLSMVKRITRKQLDKPQEIAKWIRYNIGFDDEESFFVIYMNSRCHILKSEVLFKGTENRVSVAIDVIIRRALINKSARIIVGHNHPSGNANPSVEDVKMTARLSESCKMLGLELLDHLIVTKSDFFSFKNESLL